MVTIAFVSCVKTKLTGAGSAKDLFSGSALFRYSYAYAQSLRAERILLLTTEYGLVFSDETIDEYDRSPNKMGRKEWAIWAQGVMQRLTAVADPGKDRFVFVTGRKYSDALRPFLAHVQTPLEGMQRGRRLHFLKTALEGGK